MGGLVDLVLHVALPIGVRGQGDAQTPVLAGFVKDFDRVYSLVVLFAFVGLVQKYGKGLVIAIDQVNTQIIVL